MSELKLWLRLSLFFSSFVPLWIIFLIFIFRENNFVFEEFFSSVVDLSLFLFLLIIIIAPTIIVMRLVCKMRGSRSEKITITVKQHSNFTKESLLYFVTYMIPFILHDKFDHFDFVAVLIFMCCVGAIYLKSDLIFINPLFAFMNYKLHHIIDENNSKYYVLAKNDVYAGDDIKSVRIDRYFYIEQNNPS